MPTLVHPAFHPATDGGLSSAVASYFNSGIKPTTWARYTSACRRFIDWMVASGLSSGGVCPPPSVATLCFYSAHRARSGILPAGIRQELTAVSQLFLAHGFDHPLRDPATGRTLFRLYRVLRGISLRHSAATRTRLPLTTGLLRKIHPVLGVACPWAHPNDLMLLWSALTLGVYGMLRISEFSCPGATKSSEWSTRRGDIHLVSEETGEMLVLTLRDSKTDYARQGVTLKIFANGSSTCPVAAFKAYAAVSSHRQQGDPLYTLEDGSFLARDRLTVALRRALAHVGYDPLLFASHSLRIGGVVSAAACGAGIQTLKKLGRWVSDCVLTYLQLPDAMVRDAHRGMGAVSDADLENSDLRHKAYAARSDDL